MSRRNTSLFTSVNIGTETFSCSSIIHGLNANLLQSTLRFVQASVGVTLLLFPIETVPRCFRPEDQNTRTGNNQSKKHGAAHVQRLLSFVSITWVKSSMLCGEVVPEREPQSPVSCLGSPGLGGSGAVVQL